MPAQAPLLWRHVRRHGVILRPCGIRGVRTARRSDGEIPRCSSSRLDDSLALVAAACGGGDDETTAEPTTTTEAAATTTEAPATTTSTTSTTTTTTYPRSHGDKVLAGDDCVCSDGSDYSYWVREGDPGKVMLFFDLLLRRNLRPNGWTFSRRQGRSTRRNWTMIFMPYCTGDGHLTPPPGTTMATASSTASRADEVVDNMAADQILSPAPAPAGSPRRCSPTPDAEILGQRLSVPDWSTTEGVAAKWGSRTCTGTPAEFPGPLASITPTTAPRRRSRFGLEDSSRNSEDAGVGLHRSWAGPRCTCSRSRVSATSTG